MMLKTAASMREMALHCKLFKAKYKYKVFTFEGDDCFKMKQTLAEMPND